MKNIHKIGKELFITSDEEIKDLRPHKGKWQLEKGQILNKFPNYLTDLSECKLVILTTDQDLINDGVQAIDDDFLEWFVKNPSCERVEVEEEDYSQKCRECGETVKRGYNCSKECFMKSGNFIPTDKNIKYKIIIPKEEPKQFSMDADLYEKTWIVLPELSKPETLEEAACIALGYEYDYWLKLHSKDQSSLVYIEVTTWCKGAKWQAERMYSEEEVEHIVSEALESALVTVDLEQWFKQFKKK